MKQFYQVIHKREPGAMFPGGFKMLGFFSERWMAEEVMAENPGSEIFVKQMYTPADFKLRDADRSIVAKLTKRQIEAIKREGLPEATEKTPRGRN